MYFYALHLPAPKNSFVWQTALFHNLQGYINLCKVHAWVQNWHHHSFSCKEKSSELNTEPLFPTRRDSFSCIPWYSPATQWQFEGCHCIMPSGRAASLKATVDSQDWDMNFCTSLGEHIISLDGPVRYRNSLHSCTEDNCFCMYVLPVPCCSWICRSSCVVNLSWIQLGPESQLGNQNHVPELRTLNVHQVPCL